MKRKRKTEKELNDQFALFQQELDSADAHIQKKRKKNNDTSQIISAGPTFNKKTYKVGSKGLTANVSSEPIIIGSSKTADEILMVKKISSRNCGKGGKKFVRNAGGEIWEDNSLGEWPENDFRIFVGDIGRDVTDRMLTETFNKYESFAMAKVVKNKKTGKGRGYGFVSLLDPKDFTKALMEMDGQYIGERPCKLRKSTWKDRNKEEKKKKGKYFVFKKPGEEENGKKKKKSQRNRKSKDK